MTTDTSPGPARYDLPLPDKDGPRKPRPRLERFAALPKAVLAKNARWFCSLRWVVIFVLAAFGLFSLLDDWPARSPRIRTSAGSPC